MTAQKLFHTESDFENIKKVVPQSLRKYFV